MRIAVKVDEIVKSFGSISAVDGVSFDVKENEIFGLVGPDGAGKTTTIRILCGLVRADSGNVSTSDTIGYLSQTFSLYGDLTVDENIEFFAEIHDVKDFRNRREELLEFTRLKPFRRRLAGKLSGGMKQKLALACTLIYKPKILFLDEPTTGVDPVSRREFWKIILVLRNEGVTMVIATPYLDEAEKFDRIVMLSRGKVLKTGTPEEIKSNFKNRIIEIISSDARKAFAVLKDNGYQPQLFGGRLDITADNYTQEIKSIKKILNEQGIIINKQRQKDASLENVFIELMGK